MSGGQVTKTFPGELDLGGPAFGKALREAAEKGIKILAYDCIVTPDKLEVDKKVEVRL